jgi:putative two-component system response regulator
MPSAPIHPKATLLVVDDSPDNLALINRLLKDSYTVRAATNGERALQLAATSAPDLILLDVVMPGMSGYDVCQALKALPQTRDVPVIFLTAKSDTDDETLGFELGAVDYITKPVNPRVLAARVHTQLALKASADFLRDQNGYLEQQAALRTRELAAIQDVTILAMASLAETRDNDTGNHIRRTQHYVRALAAVLQHHPRFSEFLTERHIALLFKSAPLHDIGKVGIPDHILLKPGAFSATEFDTMKTHTTLGYQAIACAEASLGSEVEFLRMAKDIALFHHEKWDGSGYPHGLRGDAIPISARLMALADVYDALISRRIYKRGMSHAAAARIILEGRATHFDPDVVDAFDQLQTEFQHIAAKFADSDTDLARKASPALPA